MDAAIGRRNIKAAASPRSARQVYIDLAVLRPATKIARHAIKVDAAVLCFKLGRAVDIRDQMPPFIALSFRFDALGATIWYETDQPCSSPPGPRP